VNDSGLSRAYQAWVEQVLKPLLDKVPERKDSFATSSGIELAPVELPQEAAGDYLTQLGLPGMPPFTRGIHPNMYRSRLWTMRQYAGFGTAAETNQRFRFLLEQGQTGLSVAFDLPTQIGMDPDHPLAAGEVGRVGVSIAAVDNLASLFEDIPLERVSTSMTINAPAAILLAMYLAVGRRQAVSPAQLQGTIQNDILKEYVARGTYIFPPEPAMRLITDTFAYCAANVPKFNTISISGYHLREAGATAVQEVAFTFANAIAYLEAAQRANLALEDFLPRVSFFFSADRHFLEEIAKFRAGRRLWARLLEERFGVTAERSRQLRFHAQTAGSTLTAQQPHNNVVRVALQALAAVLGGAQSLHTNSMDEALGLPTQQAAQLALRTQQIIAHESGVADTVDPLGGSYALEHLTDEIEAHARHYLQQVDDLGGALAAIERGFPQREIQQSAYELQQSIEAGESVIVGVNQFQEDGATPLEMLQLDPEVERSQLAFLERLKAERSTEPVQAALDQLAEAAAGTNNLLPALLTATEARATLGEVCNVLRQVWGEYNPPVTL